MRLIPIRNGISALLIIEAAIIGIATAAFMISLYSVYIDLAYNESAEVLNLHALITDSKMSVIEDLSFEILSNRDIQANIRLYIQNSDPYERHKARNDLYTQLFTRCVMNKSVLSIHFIFMDGHSIYAGYLHNAQNLEMQHSFLVKDAHRLQGASGWKANTAGGNTITLYRQIRDISGNDRFRPLGTLIININADDLIHHTPAVSQKYKPDIHLIAGDQILTRSTVQIGAEEIPDLVNTQNTYNIVKVNRTPYFVSVKKLGYHNWDMVYMISSHELLSSIRHINYLYGLALIMIVALVITIGYYFANALSRPIIRLKDAMKEVEEGDYSRPIKEPLPVSAFAITEVVELNRDFTQMVLQIDHLFRDVYLKQLMIADMKYRMLQQQINPHFLYNTLDTIHWKAVIADNKEIADMVKSLSKMLRVSIKGPDVITLKEDLAFVEDYVRIQKIRFEERLEFIMEIPEYFALCRIPRLTLQPIVENSIIHNLEKYSRVCRITLTAKPCGDNLQIQVEDNGIGFDLCRIQAVLIDQTEAANMGIGLKNIDQRLKMSFGDKYGILVENRVPKGARITICLPLGGNTHVDNASRG